MQLHGARQTGLKAIHLEVLALLAASDSESLSDLAERAGCAVNVMRLSVDKLAALRMVQTERITGDGGGVRWSSRLTEAGRGLAAIADVLRAAPGAASAGPGHGPGRSPLAAIAGVSLDRVVAKHGQSQKTIAGLLRCTERQVRRLLSESSLTTSDLGQLATALEAGVSLVACLGPVAVPLTWGAVDPVGVVADPSRVAAALQRFGVTAAVAGTKESAGCELVVGPSLTLVHCRNLAPARQSEDGKWVLGKVVKDVAGIGPQRTRQIEEAAYPGVGALDTYVRGLGPGLPAQLMVLWVARELTARVKFTPLPSTGRWRVSSPVLLPNR